MSSEVLLETTVWGFLSAVALLVLLAGAQGMHLTRINLGIVLGTMVEGNLDRAVRIGYLLQFAVSWLQAFVYLLVFWAVGEATWYIGMILGLGHGLFLLAVVLPWIPTIHPRMASENNQRPTALLEPPGFMGLHYGPGTPIVALLAYALYGTLLGATTCIS